MRSSPGPERHHRRGHGAIGDYGLYAVFLLMLVDALFPAASEVVMVYAGCCGGAFAGQSVTLFGHELESGFSCIPRDGARRDARLHRRLGDGMGDRRLRRAAVPRATGPLAASRRGEAGPRRGVVRAVGGLGRLLGRLTVVRSFISVPGVFRVPFVRYTVLTLVARRSGASRWQGSAGRWARTGRPSTTRSASRITSWRRPSRQDRVAGLEAAGAETRKARQHTGLH